MLSLSRDWGEAVLRGMQAVDQTSVIAEAKDNERREIAKSL